MAPLRSRTEGFDRFEDTFDNNYRKATDRFEKQGEYCQTVYKSKEETVYKSKEERDKAQTYEADQDFHKPFRTTGMLFANQDQFRSKVLAVLGGTTTSINNNRWPIPETNVPTRGLVRQRHSSRIAKIFGQQDW